MPGKCYVSLSALSGVFSIFTPVVLGLSVAESPQLSEGVEEGAGQVHPFASNSGG
jgi:hypothetical protein